VVLTRRSGGATAAAVDVEQPARVADTPRPAGATPVVASVGGEPLEHLALRLALRGTGRRTGLQEGQKGMLIHGMSPDFVMEIVTM
jgi:hypothetical protein